jgi:hypothetical protein
MAPSILARPLEEMACQIHAWAVRNTVWVSLSEQIIYEHCTRCGKERTRGWSEWDQAYVE